MRKLVWHLVLGVVGFHSFALELRAAQPVWLDFATDFDPGEHVYTATEQSLIRDTIAADYSGFDYSFTLIAPGSGDYSTLTFNADGIVGGIADDIDFRNLNHADNARININALLGGIGQPAATSANFVGLTSTVGSHELGHLSGLRHGDSMGPIGSGISPVPGTGGYVPAYPGPTGADETAGHIMASPAAVGSTLFDAAGDTFLSERSAVKLSFNEQGSVVAEQVAAHGTLPTAQALTLAALTVPNTLLSGDNLGKILSADAVVVTGGIAAGGETDIYSFSGSAGDLMNFEVISAVLDRIANSIDSEIRIRDSGGALVDYFGSTAFNDREFESNDSILIDLVLPSTDTYYVEVNADSGTDTGNYELYAMRFSATTGPIPEPSSILLFGTGLAALGLALRRTPPSRPRT